MFRRLKNVYFLSKKNYSLKNKWQKFPDTARVTSPVFNIPNQKILRLLTENGTSPDWEKILKTMKCGKPHSEWAILWLCGQNQLGKQLLSFVEYLIAHDRFYPITVTTLITVIDKHFEAFHPLVYNIFLTYVGVDNEIAENCAAILAKIPLYKDKVLQLCLEKHVVRNFDTFVAKNSSNKVERAKSLLSQSVPHSTVVNTTLEILNGEENVDVTQLIIGLIRKLSNSRDEDKYYKSLCDIMRVTNEKNMDYSWDMRGDICKSRKCKFCGENLPIYDVTQEELDVLFAEFETHIIHKYLTLPDTQKKWTYFVKFLNYHDYDIVVDGMNMYYALQSNPTRFLDKLHFFTTKQLKPLVIMKHEIRGVTNISTPFLFCNLRHEEYDDFYTIYAALKRGKGCKIVTRDNFGFFIHVLGDNEKIYKKWKGTHFVKTCQNGGLVWPLGVKFGVCETRCDDPLEYRCHVTLTNEFNYGFTFCIRKLKVR